MKKRQNIPLHILPSGAKEGIIVGRARIDGSPNFAAVERSHRDSGHLFILQEAGTALLEVDFEIHELRPHTLIYIHPSQVHRIIAYEQATVSSWIITDENLQPEYLALLNDLAPVKPLAISQEAAGIISQAVALSIALRDLRHEKLYDSMLKTSCNTQVALVLSQYLAVARSAESHSRFESLSKSFKDALEQHYSTLKSPAQYAALLNVSVPYLNECVKNATGMSVTRHIQQRVMLEAKRLLFHSDKSIKEIAVQLGYDDYSYFTRLFVKVAGTTPVLFRSKNLE